MLIAILSLNACDLNDGRQSGILKVNLTDAPADYTAVWVDVQSVRVHRTQNAETNAEQSDRQAEENGWITVMEQSRRINLLTLRNGNEITLGEADLAPGTYNQLRFFLGTDNEVIIDGKSYPLRTPGQQQSGTKLNINTTIEEGQTHTLLIDFDAARSVVETGNERFILKPVLRAANRSDTGSISGSVNPAEIRTHVLAVHAEDTLSTLTDDNGEFRILGVSAGRYRIEYSPISERYDDATISEVRVLPGESLSLETMNLLSPN